MSRTSSSVQTSEPISTKCTPNMYFGLKYECEKLFWKSSKTTPISVKETKNNI